jgi:hypothetical protein
VIAPHLYDLTSGARVGHTEPITFALDDERGDCHRVELGQAVLRRLAGAAWGLERECQAEDGDGACRFRGAASDAGTERTTTYDEWQAGELTAAQALEDGDPGGVELGRRCGRPTAGNAVRLLHQRDGKPLGLRCVRRCPEIRRFDASSSPVAENERRAWLWRGTQVGVCHPVRRVDLDNRHVFQYQLLPRESKLKRSFI